MYGLYVVIIEFQFLIKSEGFLLNSWFCSNSVILHTALIIQSW